MSDSENDTTLRDMTGDNDTDNSEPEGAPIKETKLSTANVTVLPANRNIIHARHLDADNDDTGFQCDKRK